MKKVIILIVLLWASPCWAATYYMRYDGTAANKAAASGPCGTQANCMSIATHDADTFSAGDIINLCDDGGDYLDQMDTPSSGSIGSVIKYQNAVGDTPIINGSSDVITGGWGDVSNTEGYGNNVWRKNIGSTSTDRTIFNGTVSGVKDATPDSDYEWTYSDPNLDVYAEADPDGYYTAIEPSQREGIVLTGEDYLTFEGITIENTNNYGIRINTNSDNIVIDTCTFIDSDVSAQGDGLDMDDCDFDNTNPGTAGAFIYVTGGQNVTVDDCTFEDGDGIQMHSGDEVAVSGCDFEGWTGDIDDLMAIAAIGADSTNVDVDDCTFLTGYSGCSLGARVDPGYKIENITFTNCTLTDTATLMYIKPGLYGAAGGGTINNVTVSDCTMTSDIIAGGGGVIHINAETNTGSTVSNITVYNITFSGEINGVAGIDAFIKIETGTDTLNGLTVSNSSFTNTGAGVDTQFNYSVFIDNCSTISNILLDNLIFDDPRNDHLRIHSSASYTDPVILSRITVLNRADNILDDSNLGGPFTWRYSVFNGDDITIDGDTGHSFVNITMYNGALTVNEDFTLTNSIIYNDGGNDITIAAGKTVTGTYNSFQDATRAGTGTYSDGSSTTLWSSTPQFIAPTTDFRLHRSSPCIDTGTNGWSDTASVVDVDGNTITNDAGVLKAYRGVIDMGAYEYQGGTFLLVQ